MIHMERPSMVVNDQRSNRRYRMDETTSSSASTSMEALVARINRAAHQLGRPIENLILNSHGFPGGIEMGTGLHEGTMWPFHAIRGKVRKIWFRA